MKFGFLVEFHGVVQPHFVGVEERVVAVGVVVQGDVGAVAEDAGLDPADLARSDHRQVVGPAGLFLNPYEVGLD